MASTRPAFPGNRSPWQWRLWLLLTCACIAMVIGAYRKMGPSQAFGADTQPLAAASQAASKSTGFVLRSPEVADGGDLPVDYTGDGTSSTLPLEWSGAPAGTKCYALIMHHLAPDGTKWYWIVYNIPADVTRLAKNAKGVGTLGNNSVNSWTEYAPPHSKGPGAKTYVLTVYALSAAPKITVPAGEVNREVLLAAMKDLILASAELHVNYTRFPEPAGGAAGNGPPPPNRGTNPPPGPPRERPGP
jgi:phosphatidylethanolamine-binding protein (PEBP) family uncharacterized protein